MTIGSSLFIESWREKQKVIQFFWALDADVVDKDDERAE
jgi:hypothetical protein